MSNDEINDVDLQKALAQSAEEYGLPAQEYGTIRPENAVHFGPANQNATYEQGKWDLVHMPSVTSQEASQVPGAFDRRRESDTPAFLRPSATDMRLPSLLTIYHEIPLAREIFLDRDIVLSDYGYDKRWWEGDPINQVKPISKLRPESESDEIESQNKTLVYEVQRLMAFLDKTDRSYGSAEVLSNMNNVKKISALDIESKFLEAWKRLHEKQPVLDFMFSTALQPKSIDEDLEHDAGPEVSGDAEALEFHMLDLELPVQGSSEIQTLYELADYALWSTSGSAVSSSAYISHIGDIVAFRLRDTNNGKSIQVPMDWYPDRYLEENREAALKMRLRKEHVRENIKNISSLREKLTHSVLPNGHRVRIHDLFESCLMHDAERVTEDNSNNPPPQLVDVDNPAIPMVVDKMDISTELRKVMANIDIKLQALDKEKERAQSTLRELSRLYTDRSDPVHPPLHRYSLRGVSATKNTTFLLRQAEPDLIDMDLDQMEPRANGDQWWKITFTASNPKPAEVKKVTQSQVLEAIANECRSPILVYANEKALAEPVQPLTASLEHFVRTDNLEFGKEFRDTQSQTNSPRSPRKRNYDASSVDSQDIAERYVDPGVRWGSGGVSPKRADDKVHVSQREVNEEARPDGWGFDTSCPDGLPSLTQDVIMGVHPSDLIDTSISDHEKPEESP
ncbi:MAG: hypothetical protein M1818_000167 [Claussenomyces sp. TS43310]|nr:MAG: hypothetical protein M1818_000167 [Claussenomyces sp. TS43310]